MLQKWTSTLDTGTQVVQVPFYAVNLTDIKPFKAHSAPRMARADRSRILLIWRLVAARVRTVVCKIRADGRGLGSGAAVAVW